jgi:glyoxylase-like metal-dependent hydrolase (beta-lactamase superfamily II)
MNLQKLFLPLLVAPLIGCATTKTAATPEPATPCTNGYFKTHIGDFEVTVISDGTVDLPMSKLLANIKPEEYKKAIAQSFLTDPIETSDNSFLVKAGSKLILIDTGAGKLFGPTLGKFVANLRSAGYKPEQIDAILITHMHPDHVGGLMADGKMVFPNATIYADKAESDFWLSADIMAKAPESSKGFFQGAQASVNPYVQAGKLKSLNGDTEIVPGVKSHPSHGHTAGHTTYIIESKGQKLVLMGDLVHVAAVQFAKPSVTIQFDSDQKAAEANRKAAFADAAKEGDMIGATHISFPGLGHVRTEKKGYVFVPLNYNR